jgi:hypothetical protein
MKAAMPVCSPSLTLPLGADSTAPGRECAVSIANFEASGQTLWYTGQPCRPSRPVALEGGTVARLMSPIGSMSLELRLVQ